MRSFLAASLVVAGGLATTALASPHEHRLPTRKTVAYGPPHPHAVFSSTPQDYVLHSVGLNTDPTPIDVARAFLENKLLTGRLSSESTFIIRDDSYTDKNTGITHVYVRQVVNGVEVVDGDININIRDGRVWSYGDSFYKGAPPTFFEGSQDISHMEYCERVSGHYSERVQTFNSHQVSNHLGDEHNSLFGPLQQVLRSYNHFAEMTLEPKSKHPDDIFGPKAPLLQFMAAITPNPAHGKDIAENFDVWMNQLVIVDDQTNHLLSDEPNTVYVDKVPETVNPVKAKIGYIQVPNKSGDGTELVLVWKFEVEMQDNWYEASVSAASPHCIISVVDWASDAPIPIPHDPSGGATYEVFQWGLNDPTEGKRTIEKELFDPLASPAGWHALPVEDDPSLSSKAPKDPKAVWRNTTTTWGNNVFAQENWEGQNAFIDNYRPDAGEERAFRYRYDPKQTEQEDALDEAKKYINFTVTQLFYTANLVHDIFYRYGFDEVSGNFQQHNFGRGGKGGDAVIANAQDGSGYNNANFMTPPDGQNGRMRMYLWNTATPFRDGDLEAGIVIHELAHGLSTRLTGGPGNSNCLGWGESGGMGEGWGDFLATHIRSNKGETEYAMGAWASNRPGGIRKYPYSLNETTNPSTYKFLDKPDYWGVHAIGEVWAEILWTVSQNLVKKHGYSKNMYPPVPEADGSAGDGTFYKKVDGLKGLIPRHGNTLSIQLVVNAMKLQSCRPTFFDARDAIIQADQLLTGGENFCEIWSGFSERGLGVDAKFVGSPWGVGIRTNGFEKPTKCQGKIPGGPQQPLPAPEDPKGPSKGPFTKQFERVSAWVMSMAGWWFPL